MIPAHEARLVADAHHTVHAEEKRLRKIEEEIKHYAAKGHYKLAVADMPRTLWEKLRDAGYTVNHLIDGYEISWGHPDDMVGGDNVG
jgi:hypothetical protein